MLQTKLETPASARRMFGICLGFGAALTLGLSSLTYGQDCGAGDVSSTELCLVDEDEDTVNGGCNSVPAVFEPANVGGSIDGTVSTYIVAGTDTRDTDWYLVTAAEMTAADLDGNGVVRLSHTGSSEAPVVLFIVAFGDPQCTGTTIIGTTGFAGPNCLDGDPAEAYVVIADHPNGLAYYIAPGNPDGTSITTGFDCTTGNNDYVITMEITEPPTSCAPGSGNCAAANGTPGCDNPSCCAAVCALDEICCTEAWDQACADLAVLEGCATASCDPTGTIIFNRIGSDDGTDLGGNLYANQRFGDFPTFNIAAAEPFTVPAPGFTLSCVEVVMDGFGADWQGNFDGVTAWSFEIYSSADAAGASLTGDVASLVITPTSINGFNGSFLGVFDVSGGTELQPGSYFIAVIPTMDFAGFGQTAIRESIIADGDDGAIQANPAGGFGFGAFQALNSNLAFRLVGNELAGNPCPWDLDGSGAIGTNDLLILFAQWGTAGAADFDGNGSVGTQDLLILFAHWGPCP